MDIFASLHNVELPLIASLQQALGTGLRVPMMLITYLGSEAFIIAIVPILFWCINRKKGAELGLLVLGSTFINLWLKALFAAPRPFHLDPSLGMAFEATPGMPSGHSQLSLIFWISIAGFLPSAIRIPAVILIPLLVGFSRVYLGVHFPSDVLGGYVAGGIILLLYQLFSGPLEKTIKTWDFRMRIVLVAAVAFVMNLLLPDDTSISGAFLGSAVGFILCAKDFPFSEDDPRRAKVLRYLLGLAGTAAIYFLLKAADTALQGATGGSQARLARFVRYALLGGWVSLGAPFMFLKLGLAKQEPAQTD
ncbi:MAG: phosphatase PAP2 family protein [Rectinema sp.]|nr:phosphatase PAP2 family protein [Rectinema sp.]